jgi:tRNA wybutosine-synthesizing protein 1
VHKKFKIDGVWHTHINYPKFIELANSGEWKNKTALDYALPTPNWALAGSKEEGFDPLDTRHYRKGKSAEKGEEKKAGKMMLEEKETSEVFYGESEAARAAAATAAAGGGS